MQTYTQTITVSEAQLAQALGSGTLPVYGTPALIALMENTAQKAIDFLPSDETTVGISINAKHVKASPMGTHISCTATITTIEGRKISFSIEAHDESGTLIGTATHERFVVNSERFLAKL